VYDFDVTAEARDQITALPAQARPYLAELITFLELTPWNGRSASDKDRDAPLRTQAFGPHGEELPRTGCTSTSGSPVRAHGDLAERARWR
jgi:hypothetical protein